MLRQRQRAGAPDGIGQIQLPAVTQGVFRHACRRANATGQVARSIRHAQQFALRLDDFADQGLVAGSDVYLGGRKRFWRNADDLYLIRHQPKYRGDFVSIASRNGPQAQIAGVGINIRERHERFTRLDVKCQQAWNLPH